MELVTLKVFWEDDRDKNIWGGVKRTDSGAYLALDFYFDFAS